MPLTYRRPGVYLEESLLINPSTVSGAFTVACFVGAAARGQINEPVLCESWSDYVNQFGGFDPFVTTGSTTKALSYLPFAVYSFFQNGGRFAWIIRAVPSAQADAGEAASITVNGSDTGATSLKSFDLVARSVGTWGDTLQYNLKTQGQSSDGNTDIFALQVMIKNAEGQYEVVETFTGLTVSGDVGGTRKVDSVINDAATGSQFIFVTNVNVEQLQPEEATSVPFTGGVDPKLPDASALTASAEMAGKLEGPININVCGYLTDAAAADTPDAASKWIGTTVAPTVFGDRQDIFIINDSAAPRPAGTSSSAYKTSIQTALGFGLGDSYSASYTPWLLVPHPSHIGQTIAIPPGGAVIGMMARIDSTVGVFRAPAGVIAGLSNAVGVQTRFTDTELGDLNANNINVVRSLVGNGICVMGGRTRKTYGTDKYINARRTLIYIKEALRRSTQFAVFENNDQRLWSALRMSAERILRPLWSAGGLKGASSQQAYYIRCDETLNNPSVIASGEVHMEVGVALQYPAEFVIIRITQYDQGTFANEIIPAA